ncbi:hypothetical protein [Acinetobacter sp. RF14B]|uniref:hypothetical protein n=1 Tax=Acinetobacter sp. RF14B TaxID=2650965 RepID=UPI0012938B12|nr:hypothetical protein [Acinetobacter sp. RF14B]
MKQQNIVKHESSKPVYNDQLIQAKENLDAFSVIDAASIAAMISLLDTEILS